MALARISQWLCGGKKNDEDNVLKTESTLSTENRLNVGTVNTNSNLKIDNTSVDVNVKAPKIDPVTVEHRVDILGPAISTLARPFNTAHKMLFQSGANIQDSPGDLSPTNTPKRSATVGSRDA